MTKKRILVTGASSPLSRAIGRHLQKGGYAALGTVRNQQKTANLGMFEEISLLDLSNPFDEISLDESVDAIIHVAAESYGTPEQMMTINAIGTYRLASAAIASGIPKFV